MIILILYPIWFLIGSFPAFAWSWSRDGFIDSILSDYERFDQAARSDVLMDGVITETELVTSLYKQADVIGNNDNKVSRDEFIDYYAQRFNISSELGTIMFDQLNDPKSNDDVITSADVSLSSFSGKNYATVAEFRDGLQKWLRQSADKLYTVLMSPHVIDTRREPEIRYSVIVNSMDANNDNVITVEEIQDEFKRMNPNDRVRRRDWVWRNTQRYEADPVTANLAFDYWDRDKSLDLTSRDFQYLADLMDLNGNNKVERDEFVRFIERGYKLSKRVTGTPLSLTMIRCPEPWWTSTGWSPNIDANRAAMDVDDDLNGWVTVADLRRWLHVFDDDDDDSISRREYTKFNTERYGVNSTVASAMFDLADTNGDDKIDEHDWEFQFKDGFSLSFCDARRSILDLTRMAEQFRGIRQGREIRDAMQRHLQEEWSWYIQNRQQEPNSRWQSGDSTNKNQDVCGSSLTCYIGEYTDAWAQPSAWLWWGMADSVRRVGGAENQFGGQVDGNSRPVSVVSNQMSGFVNPVNQLGGVNRPGGGLQNTRLGSSGQVFDQSPWSDPASMGPMGGIDSFPYFRRAIDNPSETSPSEKSVKNDQYFSTYQRLFSPFSEPANDATPTPSKPVNDDFTKQRTVSEQRKIAPNKEVETEQDFSDIKAVNSLDPPRARAPSSTNGEPTQKTKTENNQEAGNEELDPDWVSSQLPVIGYPVVFGLDPWMLGGMPQWGMFGRKKREEGFYADDRQGGEDVRQHEDAEDVGNEDAEDVGNEDAEDVGNEDGIMLTDENRTVERDDSVDWKPMMPPSPGFGIHPWDFWVAWAFEDAMWDTLSQLNELQNTNGSYAVNDTESQQSSNEQIERSDTDADQNDKGSVQNEDVSQRHRRDANDSVKEGAAEDSVTNKDDRDKRFAPEMNNFYWPLILDRWRRQFPQILARDWSVMMPSFNDYIPLNNGRGFSSFSMPWGNSLQYQNPWVGKSANWNQWRGVFGNDRFKRNAEEVDKETAAKEDNREESIDEGDNSRRDSSQARSSSSDDSGDSVWRSASKKYATKEDWGQDTNNESPEWSSGTDERYDYTTNRWSNENVPTHVRPTQPGWWRNMLSGTDDRWKGVQSGLFKNPWEDTYGQPFTFGDVRPFQQNIWDNVVPRTFLSSVMTSGPDWSNWGETVDGGFGFDEGVNNPFGGTGQWSHFPVWPEQWQDGFSGSPRHWLPLRDTTNNVKELENLWRLWFGRFSRDTQHNGSTEGQSDTANIGDEREASEKGKADSGDNRRHKRWANGFGFMNNPFVSFQPLPSWASWIYNSWCQKYWSTMRFARSVDEPRGGDQENVTKRSSATEGDKDKRWDDAESSQNEYSTNWVPTLWDIVCPRVLQSSMGYGIQDNIGYPTWNGMYQYQGFRKKREVLEDHDVKNGDSVADDPRGRRWEQWRDRAGEDYDCWEWVSEMSVWSPWKGWNLLRSNRESGKITKDSDAGKNTGTITRSHDGEENNRAVRCRSWYKKYRNSNGIDQRNIVSKGYNNLRAQDGSWDEQFGRDLRTASDAGSSQGREKRDTTRKHLLKRQGQTSYPFPRMFPLMVPYPSSHYWNRWLPPQFHQSGAPQVKPEMYPSFGYANKWSNPFDAIRGLRATKHDIEEADITAEERQKHSADKTDLTAEEREKRRTEETTRNKRFWGQVPGGHESGWLGQNSWSTSRSPWDRQAEPFYSRQPLSSRFTNYGVPQFGGAMQDYMRQQRSAQSKDERSSAGTQTQKANGMGRDKRSLDHWGEYPQQESSGREFMLPWNYGFRHQNYPDFWNKGNWQVNRNRRNANVQAQNKDKRFAVWEDWTLNSENKWMQQLQGNQRSWWPSQWQDQYNTGRYLRDADREEILGGKTRQKREAVDNSRPARQEGLPGFGYAPGRDTSDELWRYGNVNPTFSNNWRSWPRQSNGFVFTPSSAWGPRRFTRDSYGNEEDVRTNNKTGSEKDTLFRNRRWDNSDYFSRIFSNDWNGHFGNQDMRPWKSRFDSVRGSDQSPWGNVNNWGTRRFIRGSDVLQDNGRSKRSADEGSKTKRWYEQQEPLQFTQSNWRQPYKSDIGQGWDQYTSNYQKPFVSPSFVQGGSNWQRSDGYPWQQSPWSSTYGSNHGPGTRPLLWDNIQSPLRFPRGFDEQEASRIKRDAQDNTRTKRWQLGRQFPSQSSNILNPNREGYGNYGQLEFANWRDNSLPSFMRYPRQQEQSEDKRWELNEQDRGPVDGQRNPTDLFDSSNNQQNARNWPEKDEMNSGEYLKNSMDEKRKINNRRATMWGSNSPWQKRDQLPWGNNPQWRQESPSYGWGSGWIDAPSQFGDQRSGAWNPLRFTRQIGRKGGERNKRDLRNNMLSNRWQDDGWFPSARSWSPHSTGDKRSGFNWAPQTNWGGEYMRDFSRYTRETIKDEAPGRNEREVDVEDRTKRWYGTNWGSPVNWLGTQQNPFDSVYNLDRARSRQPSWGDENIWNHMRFLRGVNDEKGNQRNKRETDATKSKRWMQSDDLPWFEGTSQLQWDPQGQGSSWSQKWDTRSIISNPWLHGWNLNSGDGRDNSVWRYPRETSNSNEEGRDRREIEVNESGTDEEYHRENSDSHEEVGRNTQKSDSWVTARDKEYNREASNSTARDGAVSQEGEVNGSTPDTDYLRETSSSRQGNVNDRQESEAEETDNGYNRETRVSTDGDSRDREESTVHRRHQGHPTDASNPSEGDGRGKRESQVGGRTSEKRLQNWFQSPLSNWDMGAFGLSYGIPWYSGPVSNPWFDNKNVFKRNTEESKESFDDIASDNKDGGRTKRWEALGSVPSHFADQNLPIYSNPLSFSRFSPEWYNPFRSTIVPDFIRQYRQTNRNDLEKISDILKRSTEENTREKRWGERNSFPNLDWNSLSGRARLPVRNNNPWFTSEQGWNNRWNFERYRRSSDGGGEKDKGNVKRDARNKRQHYWGNILGNNWQNSWWNSRLNSWPLYGSFPYNPLLALSPYTPYMSYRSPYLGIDSFRNRSPVRYYRDTDTAEEREKLGGDDISRDKRWYNDGMMARNAWDNGLNQKWLNSRYFSSQNSWNPYYRGYGSVPGQRFYRDTESNNGSFGEEPSMNDTENISRVRRFREQLWDYQNDPSMYYGNSWTQQPAASNGNSWFRPINPWYMPSMLPPAQNSRYPPLFFGILRGLRHIKGSDDKDSDTDERLKRQAGYEDQRQRHWLNGYGGPAGYRGFGSDRSPYGQIPYRERFSSDKNRYGLFPRGESPAWLTIPAFGDQNLYTSLKPSRSWIGGLDQSNYGSVRGLRMTGSDGKGGDERKKRQAASTDFGRNFNGGGWDNAMNDGRNSGYPWSVDGRQTWNVNKQGFVGQQWRSDPSYQWGKLFKGETSGYPRGYDRMQTLNTNRQSIPGQHGRPEPSRQWNHDFPSRFPVNFKRSSDNAAQGTGSDEKIREKRDADVIDPQRQKRWWRQNGSSFVRPQFGIRTDWPSRQNSPWESNPSLDPQYNSQYWSDERNGMLPRQKRESKVEESGKNKRWEQLDSSIQNMFSKSGWENPSVDLWRSVSSYPGFGIQAFNPLQNPGNQAFNPLQNPGSQAFNPLQNPGSQAFNPLQNPGSQAFNPLQNPGSQAFNPLQNPGSQAFNPLQNPGSQAFNPLQNPGSQAFNPLQNPGSQAFNPLQNPGSQAFNPLQNPGSQAFNPLQSPGNRLWSSFSNQNHPYWRSNARVISYRKKRLAEGLDTMKAMLSINVNNV